MSRLPLPDPPLSDGTTHLLRRYRRRRGEREDLVMFSLLAEEVV